MDEARRSFVALMGAVVQIQSVYTKKTSPDGFQTMRVEIKRCFM